MKSILITLTLLLFVLAGCSPSGSAESSAGAANTNDTAVASAPADAQESASTESAGPSNANRAGESTATTVSLKDSYKDALSVTGQLAVGTLNLEQTDQAVTEDEAAELLPLWQALQALSQSDMTAEIELEAVVNQIQETMTPGQIQAITDMALTSESLAELQSSGALAMGSMGGFGDQAPGSSDRPAGDFGGGAGGPPDGGMGGPPGGGMGPGNALDEDALATRQAQFEDGSMEDSLYINMVTRLLQTKTGQAPAFARGGDAQMAAMAAIIDATGLAMPDIQNELAAGKSLAEIAADNGADLEAVKATLQETLSGMELPGDLELEPFIDQLLSGTR